MRGGGGLIVMQKAAAVIVTVLVPCFSSMFSIISDVPAAQVFARFD